MKKFPRNLIEAAGGPERNVSERFDFEPVLRKRSGLMLNSKNIGIMSATGRPLL